MRSSVLMRGMKFRSSHLDIEMGLVVYRLCMVLLFACFLGAAHLSGRSPVPPGLSLVVGLYVLYASVWIAVVRKSLLRLKTRIRGAILLDQSLLAMALWLGGELIAPVFWAPVVVALGCGLLGGTFYAKTASAFGAILLAAAFWASPFWSGIPLVCVGILLATVLLPWHAALLAEHIAQSRKDMQRRAAAFELASKTDSLTGVLNRAGFLAALQEQVEKCGRTHTDAVLMLLDLDGFKAVNDVGGHAGGDALLRSVTRCLQQSLRASDRLGRIGGDEFGIIVSGLTDIRDAEWLAAKLLRSIEAIRPDGHPALRVTGSIGIHPLTHPLPGNLEALIEAADRLMYEAKRAGKNQFRSAFHQQRVAARETTS